MVEALAEIQQGIHRGEVAVGAIVRGSSAFAVACFEDAGKIFVRDGNVGIGLVVFEEDVVAGLVLLDEGVLEDKGLSFGAHDDVLDTADLAHQKAGLRAGYVALEVATDAATQVLRLPDVDDRALLADVLVAAGGFGERREDLAYFVERHRVLSEGGGAKSPLLQQRYGKDGALPLTKYLLSGLLVAKLFPLPLIQLLYRIIVSFLTINMRWIYQEAESIFRLQ